MTIVWPKLLSDRASQSSGVEQVALADVLKTFLAGRTLFVDVRPAPAFAMERLPGAISMPAMAVNSEFLHAAEHTNIVLYSYGEDWGLQLALAKIASTPAAKHIKVYYGGIEEWKACRLNLDY
jgi:rhodanese-related sulfurtransferase